MKNSQKKNGTGCFINSCLAFAGGLFGITAISLLVILGGYFLLRGLGAYLIIADTLKQMDAVVVLSGGGLSRREEGVKLFKQQYAKVFILTETGETVTDLGVDYSLILKQEAIRLGVPADAILITQEHASSTYEEAKAVKSLLENSGLNSCVVITDPFHTRRTRIIFQDVFKDTGIVIRVRPVIGHWYRSDTWFVSQRGWEATFQEYFKLIGFKLGFQP